MKNVIHIFGASGSGTTMARLCHSAFARVATPDLPLSGASGALCHSAFARVATSLKHLSSMYCGFATAHSRGLRRRRKAGLPAADPLPQRIRAGYDSYAKYILED